MFNTKNKSLAVGDTAPDFELPNQAKQPVRLAALLRTGPVVVFFYPKDNTLGCTAQVCAFRDAFEAFQTEGAHVVGISSDSTDSHRAFADKHGFAFHILSDADQSTRRAFGVPKTLGIVAGRVTYILDMQGVVRHIYNSQMNIQAHVTQALEQVRSLKASQR